MSILSHITAHQPVDTKGVIDVEVQYNEQCFHLPLVIAKETKYARMPMLLGRNWMNKIKIRWHEGIQAKARTKEIRLTDKYLELFESGYRAIRGFRASIAVKENASPVFCKVRSMPYALREQLGHELANFEKAGVIYRVRHST